jgi:gamma-glutamylputrescine oxidase
MSVPYWLDDSADGALVEADIIVVGGGISGFSTAYWLREAGMKVVVVDKGGLGAGATGRNAGFITCGSVEHYTRQVSRHGPGLARALWQLSQDNLRLIREEIVEGRGVDCEFRQRGTYSLAGTEHELGELKDAAALMASSGIPVTVVDEDHIRRALGARDFFGGVLYHDDGEVHPVKLTRAIAEASGATFYPHHEVYNIEVGRDEVVTLHTDKRKFRAPFVVLATNGYSPLLHDWFIDKIYPTRGQILVTDPVAPLMAAPCYCNFVLDYFRQLSDGRVLIGGFRQLAREAEVGVADVPNPEIQVALEAFLHKHFEALRGVRIAYRWAGVMGFSADGLPLIGALPQHPQIYVVGGYTGHGIGMAFRAAQMLAGVMLRGESAGPLSARRLG